MAVMIVLLALVGRDLGRTVVRLLNVTHIAALEQPLLPLSRRAGAALVQLRAPLAIETGHLRQAVATVVEVQARGQSFQVDYRAVHYVLPVEVDAMILVDGLSAHNCKARDSNVFCVFLDTFKCPYVKITGCSE